METKYGIHVCGEGGEFETMTLDCPVFHKRLEIRQTSVNVHSACEFAPVLLLDLEKVDCVEKIGPAECNEAWKDQILCKRHRLMYTPDTFKEHTDEEIHDDLANELCEIDRLLISSSAGGSHPFVAIGPIDKRNTALRSTPNVALVQEALAVMQLLQEILASRNMDFSHVVLMTVYLQDITRFSELNNAYASFFGANPAARVTIGCSLTEQIQIDCICTTELIETLHVQSISYWA